MNYKNITINTPALLIDKTVLLDNIKIMSSYTQKNRINLRPHAKSHKISEIAKIQIKYGAIGVCVATLYEAEVMSKNNIQGIIVSNTTDSNRENLSDTKKMKLVDYLGNP